MKSRPSFVLLAAFLASATPCLGEEKLSLEDALSRKVIDPVRPMAEVQAFTESRVRPMPEVKTIAEWEMHAKRIREGVLKNVVFRGEAAKWRDSKTQVKWLETIEGGKGYRIRKLRYEAIPGLWIPALLYEPLKLDGKVPVVLNVNGHDGNGKAAKYKQIRCINQAKRGMLALNVEWYGMGQLRLPNFAHYRQNQLDLCGTSGISLFYLSMKRGIDVLLSHKNADPKRVAVAGLSGGGWQTIFISSLDERVTLSNPVAGYSSFKTRARYLSDLGDSEQTPVDLGVYGDYAQLTALRAPRPTLLTNNANDNCCFKAEHALPPLVDAARPIFKIYGKSSNLRTHVNHDPGSHNFDKDNREALYQMIGDHFYPGRPSLVDWSKEIPCDDELKSKEQLEVALPEDNLDFNKIALQLMEKLKWPAIQANARPARRKVLRDILRAKPSEVQAVRDRTAKLASGETVTWWWLRIGGEWTVPAVEITGKSPKGTAIVLADAGRKAAIDAVRSQLKDGKRVLAIDPFYIGESKIAKRDFLFALLVSAVGERALGVQTGQIDAIARWLKSREPKQSVSVVSLGPRTSLMALCAAAMNKDAIDDLQMHDAFSSLKDIIENNMQVNQAPELFTFGLLEEFDIPQLAALVVPRKLQFVNPTANHRKQLKKLKGLDLLFSKRHDPLK